MSVIYIELGLGISAHEVIESTEEVLDGIDEAFSEETMVRLHTVRDGELCGWCPNAFIAVVGSPPPDTSLVANLDEQRIRSARGDGVGSGDVQ